MLRVIVGNDVKLDVLRRFHARNGEVAEPLDVVELDIEASILLLARGENRGTETTIGKRRRPRTVNLDARACRHIDAAHCRLAAEIGENAVALLLDAQALKHLEHSLAGTILHSEREAAHLRVCVTFDFELEARREDCFWQVGAEVLGKILPARELPRVNRERPCTGLCVLKRKGIDLHRRAKRIDNAPAIVRPDDSRRAFDYSARRRSS